MKKRIEWLDALKATATIAVIVLHVVASKWYSVDVKSSEWLIYDFFNALVRWAVPIFAMTTGSLLASKKIKYTVIIKKYVFKMIFIYFLTSLFYTLSNVFLYGSFNLKDIVYGVYNGPYHLWYIKCLVGVYIITPILGMICQNQKTQLGFLVFFFLVLFLIPTLLNLITDFVGCNNNNIYVIKKILNEHIIVGFLCMSYYFILGDYLYKTISKNKTKYMLYILGFAGLVLTFVLPLLVSKITGTIVNNYNVIFSVNILFMSMAIYCLFKNKTINGKLSKVTAYITDKGLLIYIVHPYVIDILRINNLNIKFSSVIITTIMQSIVVFLISLAISIILKRIKTILTNR